MLSQKHVFWHDFGYRQSPDQTKVDVAPSIIYGLRTGDSCVSANLTIYRSRLTNPKPLGSSSGWMSESKIRRSILLLAASARMPERRPLKATFRRYGFLASHSRSHSDKCAQQIAGSLLRSPITSPRFLQLGNAHSGLMTQLRHSPSLFTMTWLLPPHDVHAGNEAPSCLRLFLSYLAPPFHSPRARCIFSLHPQHRPCLARTSLNVLHGP